MCLCVIVISLRSDSDYNKEATYLSLLTAQHTILQQLTKWKLGVAEQHNTFITPFYQK